MKILQCHKFYYPSGGAERYFIDLCDSLSREGHKVIHFSTLNDNNLPSAYSRYFVDTVGISDHHKNNFFTKIKTALKFIYSFDSRRKIKELVTEFNPEIAHIHNIYHHLSSSILDELYIRKIPVVMTVHDYKLVCPDYLLFRRGNICEECKGDKYFRAVINRCVKNSYLASSVACLEMYFCRLLKKYTRSVNIFIAPSIFVKKKLIKFGLPEDKIYYLPHPINLQDAKPNFNVGRYILYYGRLAPEKGIESLLKSQRFFPNIPMKIVGDGPQKNKLRQIIKRERLHNVELLGYKSDDELLDLIKNAALVVVPSVWPEVSGLVIYEAFALGKCVIASNIGGIPELVNDRVNGLLFSPGNYKQLADKIKYLIGNPEKIKNYGLNGFNKIRQFNSQFEHNQHLLNIYKMAIDGRHS